MALMTVRRHLYSLGTLDITVKTAACVIRKVFLINCVNVQKRPKLQCRASLGLRAIQSKFCENNENIGLIW